MSQASLKIRLVLLNTNKAGERFRVESFPFVIGRNTESDLQLQHNSISRRHCELTLEEGTALLAARDLGSRNPTCVNSKPISSDVATTLYHNDTLTIGRIAFRCSIKDAKTGRPIARPNRGTASTLLDELDELAQESLSASPFETTRWFHTGIPGASDIQPSQAPAPNASESKTTDVGLSSASDLVESTGASSAQSDNVSQSAEKAEPDSDVSDKTDVASATKGPQKIPPHLRPRQAHDSQAAATEALKRLFSGGR